MSTADRNAAIGVGKADFGHISSAGVFYPTAATEAAIRAAVTLAIAAGGGTIKLPAATIQLTQPLPVSSGLIYEGSQKPGWAALTAAVATGTTLKGDGVAGASAGTFNCFEWNTADQGSLPAVNTLQLFQQNPSGFAVKNLVMRNFNYGIKLGAFQNPGVNMVELDNLVAEECNWGYWLENCQAPKVGHVFYAMCAKGGFYHASSMGSLWHYGNGTIELVQGQNSGILSSRTTKGIVIEARGSQSQLNNVTAINLQNNGIRPSLITQAAGSWMTAGSANLAISSATGIANFDIDQVVMFGHSGTTFNANKPYFVVAKTDNGDGSGTIQVARQRGGTAIVVAASPDTNTTLTTYGATGIEIGGRGDTGSVGGVTANIPMLTHCRFPFLDIEAIASVGLAVQNVIGCYFETSIIDAQSGTTQLSVLLTNASGSGGPGNGTSQLAIRRPIYNVYCDTRAIQVLGAFPYSFFGSGSGFQGYLPQGMLSDSNTEMSRVFLTGKESTGVGDIYGDDTNFPVVALGSPLRPKQSQLASSAAITSAHGNEIVYTGAGGGSLTLPAITITNAGIQYLVSNPTSGTLTVNTASSQTINGQAGVTSFSVPANSVAQFIACNNAGTLYWGVK